MVLCMLHDRNRCMIFAINLSNILTLHRRHDVYLNSTSAKVYYYVSIVEKQYIRMTFKCQFIDFIF